MDILEQMVNNHADAPKNAARKWRFFRHLNRTAVSATVAIATLIVDLLGLMHHGLAVPVMVVALMVGCYSLGRCVRFGLRRTR